MLCRNQCLIDPAEPGFRHVCRDYRQLHGNYGTPGLSAPMMVLAEEVESAVRQLFSTVVGPMDRHRVLSYEQRQSLGYRRCYRELDGVLGDRRDPQLFLEIKTVTRAGRGFRSGWGQLRTSLEVAGQRWRSLRGLLIEVAWEPVAPAVSDPVEALLDSLLQAMRTDQPQQALQWSVAQLAAVMSELGQPLDADILAWAQPVPELAAA